jgi:hypothetical protein
MTAKRTYYPEVECEATPSSLYDTEVMGVADETDNRHLLRVARGMVHRSDSKAYLPVGIVDVDRRHGRISCLVRRRLRCRCAIISVRRSRTNIRGMSFTACGRR